MRLLYFALLHQLEEEAPLGGFVVAALVVADALVGVAALGGGVVSSTGGLAATVGLFDGTPADVYLVFF